MRHPAWAIAAVILALIVAYSWITGTGTSAGRDDGDTGAAVTAGAPKTTGKHSYKVLYPVGTSYMSTGSVEYICADSLQQAWNMAAQLNPSPIVYGRGGDSDNCSQ